MMEQIIAYKNFFFCAFALLIPLLAYASFLQWRTLKQLKEKEEIQEDRSQMKRQDHIRDSIRIISMATIQEQCEISEACLRIANLLPLLEEIDHRDKKWQPLFDMYEEIKKLKTLDERKNLRAAHRHEEDKRRFASEEKYHTEMLHICQSLYDLTKEEQNV